STSTIFTAALFLAAYVALATPPQQNTRKSIPKSTTSAVYPDDEAGVLIQGSEWSALEAEAPVEIKIKRALATALSDGLIPANVVAEYTGAHAETQISAKQPFICICHAPTLQTIPVLVRLHMKKDSRELNGGRVPAPGARIAQAKETDIVPTEIS